MNYDERIYNATLDDEELAILRASANVVVLSDLPPEQARALRDGLLMYRYKGALPTVTQWLANLEEKDRANNPELF